MPYITREDGQSFVIPSYRDVLTVVNKSALKREILLLSQNYGEYITLQRKTANQYEVSFSTDVGYLLGETVWQHFNRPPDLIYCEVIPNTTEAILVIVKGGSVYIDGSFSIDSIPEELVVFLTQQNNFEIYLYGDVPISQTAEEGKFSFEPEAVKSFTILENPVFAQLPLLKIYQLQPVDLVLKAHGIGVLPIKQIMMLFAGLVVIWFAYDFMTTEHKPIAPPPQQVNPYQGYYDTLTSPAPEHVIENVITGVRVLSSIPGWQANFFNYSNGILSANLQSSGTKLTTLFNWAEKNKVKINFNEEGISIAIDVKTPNRAQPDKIYSLTRVIAKIIDDFANIFPGNHITLGNISSLGPYSETKLTINFDNASFLLLSLIGKQLQNLPVILTNLKLNYGEGIINGTIELNVLGR